MIDDKYYYKSTSDYACRRVLGMPIPVTNYINCSREGYIVNGTPTKDTYISIRKKQKSSKFDGLKIAKLSTLAIAGLSIISAAVGKVSNTAKKVFKKA